MPNPNNPNKRRPSIFEIAKMYNEPERSSNKTKVVVNTNRLHYGYNATVSAFLATAYDEQGEKVDSMQGYFLEPRTDYNLATTPNSDTAIMTGTYRITPKWNEKQKYDWYLRNTKGRTGIAIHGGINGNSTTGCLIPGNSFNTYKHEKGDSLTINNANEKKEELFQFFKKYGNDDIKINICMPDKQ